MQGIQLFSDDQLGVQVCQVVVALSILTKPLKKKKNEAVPQCVLNWEAAAAATLESWVYR